MHSDFHRKHTANSWHTASGNEFIFLLDKLKTIFLGNSCGLYRDDGLGVIKANSQRCEAILKKLHTLFNEEGLKISADTNLVTIKFLDVSLNLISGTYKPFSKPNASVKYVSQQSNHPPQVLKNIPAGINKRLVNISSNKNCFE